MGPLGPQPALRTEPRAPGRRSGWAPHTAQRVGVSEGERVLSAAPAPRSVTPEVPGRGREAAASCCSGVVAPAEVSSKSGPAAAAGGGRGLRV